MRHIHRLTLCALILPWLAVAARAAEPTTQPEATAAPDAPAARPADAKDMQAKVEEVVGSVVYRSASRQGPFQPVTKGMTLGADTLISCGRKAHCLLAFGTNSVAMLEEYSVLTIQQVYETQSGGRTVVTRLKVTNGSVRAGVERGQVKSDFKVTTPVATLSVRGTRPIRIWYDAGTGQLWFYLGSEGRIIATVTGDGAGGPKVEITPGEGTNQELLMAILLAVFDYHEQLGDPWGQTLQEFLTEVFNTNAFGGFGGGNPQDFAQTIFGGAQGGLQPQGDDNSGGDDCVYCDDDAVVGR